jgi:hypothetical protein
MSVKELNKKLTELEAALKNAAEGSDEFTTISAEIEEVQAQLEALALETAQAKASKKAPVGANAFTVDVDGKKVKASIPDVPVIYLSGVGYTVEQFLQSPALQEQAVKSNHLLISIQ